MPGRRKTDDRHREQRKPANQTTRRLDRHELSNAFVRLDRFLRIDQRFGRHRIPRDFTYSSA
jgi:hypothetical protein